MLSECCNVYGELALQYLLASGPVTFTNCQSLSNIIVNGRWLEATGWRGAKREFKVMMVPY